MREGVPADDRLVVLHREATSRRRPASRRASASRASMPVSYGRTSLRVLIAMTTSSSAALPARSPMPLMVHSICRAPPATPASELATARPRSLWQCTEKIALSAFGTRSRTVRNMAAVLLRRRVADRVGEVDRGRAGLDRGLDAAAQEVDARCGCASSADHSTSSTRLRAWVTEADDHLQDLVRLLLQLVLQVHRRGGEEGVDARLARRGAPPRRRGRCP